MCDQTWCLSGFSIMSRLFNTLGVKLPPPPSCPPPLVIRWKHGNLIYWMNQNAPPPPHTTVVMPRSELYKSTLWLQPVQARIREGGGSSRTRSPSCSPAVFGFQSLPIIRLYIYITGVGSGGGQGGMYPPHTHTHTFESGGGGGGGGQRYVCAPPPTFRPRI